MKHWTTGSWTMLRDAVMVAAVALLTFQALRRWGGDRYRVPTDSMQPFLHGDPDSGDIVFVDKLASRAACRPHDLVVVKHPQEPGQQMVKRIAAVGDDLAACWIDLRDGDVWLGDSAQRLQRDTKDPLAARGLRVPWAVWPPPNDASARVLDLRAGTAGDDGLRVPPLGYEAGAARAVFRSDARRARLRDASGRVLPTGFVGTARAVDASYVDATGQRGREGDDVGVRDCGMDLAVLAGAAGLLCTVETRHEALTFHWQAADGRLELWRNGETVEATTLPVRPPGSHRIEFGMLDDRLFFAIDGRRDALFCVPRRAAWNEGDQDASRAGGPRCHVYLGVCGAGALQLGSLVVFRDVFVWRERIAGMPGRPGDWPRHVKPGAWFLLGDNPFDSRDSRHFDAVPSSLFLGRPCAVLGPWPRNRWLSP